MKQLLSQFNSSDSLDRFHAGKLSRALPHLALTDLLQLCLQFAEETAWHEFARRTEPLIAGVVMKTVHRWTRPTLGLVEDLVQETYLKLCVNNFRALREFECEHENALYGFLKIVASNVVHDHFRSTYSQKRGSGREEEDLEQVSVSVAMCRYSMGHADRCVLLGEIDDCLVDRATDPAFARDYAIFWLYYREGLTAKAISELPSVSLSVKGVESVVGRLTRFVRLSLNALPPQRTIPTHTSTNHKQAANRTASG
jgi:RNA polymerase sigma-70 factor (ECF subfamily)